ncbi:MAG: cysteine desulfurase [Eubacterium sp.]|nr:cysteine desulfurase [Eubacterium sp.]
MIYMDNAATTRMCPAAVQAMQPYLTEFYGNPSAMYQAGRRAREAVRRSRDIISAMLGAKPDEIVFTSGGTEADNWALTAVLEAKKEQGNHIITSRIEHPAVLRTCEYLSRVRGAEITYLEPDENGVIRPETAAAAIRPDTILMSVMTANNEVGTLQPVAELGRLAHANGILFHTDAVQAFGHMPLSADEMEIDLLSASGHKFFGPKGCGFLYIRKGAGIGSMIRGGAQEYNRRAGTENVPGIVAMGAAAEEAEQWMEDRMRHETELRDYMIGRMRTEIPGVQLNGHPERRLPNNVSLQFPGISAESALIRLDLQGIAASAGSACSTGSLEPSHVLLAMGRSREEAFQSLRFTLSYETTRDEVNQVVEAMKQICNHGSCMETK